MKIGIIVAMGKELNLLLNQIENKRTETTDGYMFHCGNIGKHEIFAMQCGIGKVNAAIGTYAMIGNYSPELIINTGVAGGADKSVAQMDIVVCEKIAHHDIWCGPGTQYGEAAGCPLFFHSDDAIIKHLHTSAKSALKYGLICSGDKFISNGLLDKLNKLVSSDFKRVSHHDCIDILKKANKKWEFEPSYEEDIAKEHERWLTNHFNVPVFVKNWPAGIKAYYMKLNEDGKTVAGVDLEVPGAGELIGGSQREEKLDVLLARMKELGVEEESIEWYVNLRRYGGCIHSGFGMGFERLIMYLTGIENIRDVIPYPRTPGSCEF